MDNLILHAILKIPNLENKFKKDSLKFMKVKKI